MQDAANEFDLPLAGLNKSEWREKLAEISNENGEFTELGPRHFASYIEGVETLVVTFETVQGIRGLGETGQPLGWDLNSALDWAHLCVVADGDTWFRDEAVWDFFDELTDDGFFDAFDQVLFYGAGPCGYAAAAFSISSPGATVVAIQPQATLDPDVTEWDDRFTEMRRLDFAGRYSYAPDMIDGAERVYIIYDPAQSLDAMHAALFHKPHVTKLRLRWMGGAIQSDLMEMQILYRVLAQAGSGKLKPVSFAQLYRARRKYPQYLRRLLAAIDIKERDGLALQLSMAVTRRMNAPRFQRRLLQLEAKLGKADAAQ